MYSICSLFPGQCLGLWDNDYCFEPTPGAVLDPSCRRRPGDQCEYTCKKGYAHSHYATADCTSHGTWLQRPDALCKLILCPMSIDHGSITFPCTRKHDTICQSFKCYGSYTKTHMPLKLKCKVSGTFYTSAKGNWEWEENMGEPCIKKSANCPATFKNGKVSENCHLQNGAVCSYKCDVGCEKNPTVSKLQCWPGQWNVPTDNLCTNCRRCPRYIANGRLTGLSCNRQPTSTCGFTCNYSCRKADHTLYCTNLGEWHITSPCICSDEGKDGDVDESGSSNSYVIVVSAIAGGCVLALLFGMVCWCQRRQLYQSSRCVREPAVTVPMITHTEPPGVGRLEHNEPSASYSACKTLAVESSDQPPSYEQVLSDPAHFKTY